MYITSVIPTLPSFMISLLLFMVNVWTCQPSLCSQHTYCTGSLAVLHSDRGVSISNEGDIRGPPVDLGLKYFTVWSLRRYQPMHCRSSTVKCLFTRLDGKHRPPRSNLVVSSESLSVQSTSLLTFTRHFCQLYLM